MATSKCILKVKYAWILCGGSDKAHFVPCFVGDGIEIEHFAPCVAGDGIEIEQSAAEWRHPHAF